MECLEKTRIFSLFHIDKSRKLGYNSQAQRGKPERKCGPVVQSVSTPACHAGGRRFESVRGRQIRPELSSGLTYASVAQLVEQRTENPRVVGSIPTGGTI